eukprot:1157549-Pelagomonas_calceolata.AAC.3
MNMNDVQDTMQRFEKEKGDLRLHAGKAHAGWQGEKCCSTTGGSTIMQLLQHIHTYHDSCFIDSPLYIMLELVVKALDKEASLAVRVVAQAVNNQPYMDGEQGECGVEDLGVQAKCCR